MGKSLYVKIRNNLHPGYGECSKCGGNWGWKEYTVHLTSESSGIFLFCEDCDKIVTIEERHKALDEWKIDCIKQIINYYGADFLKEVKDILNREFIEYPRTK